MAIKGIPRTEKIWTEIFMRNGDVYYITSKENDRNYYFLYKVENNNVTKLGKSKSPLELENKYIK